MDIELELRPENNGVNCPYNGEHIDNHGNIIEYQCDECDYLLSCTEKSTSTNSTHP